MNVLTRELTNLDGGKTPIVVWLVLNALDSISTAWGLSHGADELNLFYQSTHSIGAMVALKWFVVFLVIGVFYKSSKVIWGFMPFVLVAVIVNAYGIYRIMTW